jgi:hypothetical protein
VVGDCAESYFVGRRERGVADVPGEVSGEDRVVSLGDEMVVGRAGVAADHRRRITWNDQ